MRRVASGREFLLKFRNHRVPEWIEERNLIGGRHLLVDYLAKVKASPTKLPQVVGAAMKLNVNYNSDNWRDFQSILEMATKYGRFERRFANDITIKIFDENSNDLTKDTVYLINILTRNTSVMVHSQHPLWHIIRKIFLSSTRWRSNLSRTIPDSREIRHQSCMQYMR